MSAMIKSPEAFYKDEWIFNKKDSSSPPHFGVCFSGGGHRSAAFAIGVMRAMHERGLLRKVDVMSAVSGGSYALSWLLLQPFYHSGCVSDPKAALERVQEEMFDVHGPFQQHLENNAKPIGAHSWLELSFLGTWNLLGDLVVFNAMRFLLAPLRLLIGDAKLATQLNSISRAREKYRDGIQQTYQVFPDSAKKAPTSSISFAERVYARRLVLTREDVSPVSFPALRVFAQRAGLPSFVFNTTVVPPRPGDDVPLGARIFEVGSMGFGSDSCGYLTWEDTAGLGWEPGAPVEKDWLRKELAFKHKHKDEDGEWADLFGSPYATIRNFNVAPAISGAAFSGTNLEGWKARLFLRLLNLGLEYVVPSPADPRRIVRLSDGGHCENLGAYALLRRRCRNILIVDAEYDPSYKCSAYEKLKRAASLELGIDINVPDVENILKGTSTFLAAVPVLEGTMTTDGKPSGKIAYMKLSMSDELLGDQAEIVKSYARKNEAFPQESTVDQYFEPAQFRAYRALGYAIARTLHRDFIA
jgi:hypothetical protein